jgi:hypothetical protein
MFYTSKNLLIKINDQEISTLEAQLSYEAQITPYIEVGQRHADKITPTAPIQGNLSFSYNITGEDPIKNLIPLDGPLSFDFGGIKQTGYLKGLNVRFSPHSPIVSNATINFFKAPTGNFSPVFNENNLDKNLLHIDGVSINNFNNEFITGDILNANFTYDADITPEVHIGDESEQRCVFGLKQSTMTLNFNNFNPEIKISGQRVAIALSLKSFTETSIQESYTCTGFLTRKNFQGRTDDVLTSEITIRQFNLIPEVLIESISPTTGTAGDIVKLIGKNFNYVTDVFFDDTHANFTVINNNLINATVPRLQKGLDVKISITSLA